MSIFKKQLVWNRPEPVESHVPQLLELSFTPYILQRGDRFYVRTSFGVYLIPKEHNKFIGDIYLDYGISNQQGYVIIQQLPANDDNTDKFKLPCNTYKERADLVTLLEDFYKFERVV